jgi:hypothetical protein
VHREPTFAIVVPGNNLDDIGLDSVDGLLPTVFDERVTEFDPRASPSEVLELPRRDTCISMVRQQQKQNKSAGLLGL